MRRPVKPQLPRTLTGSQAGRGMGGGGARILLILLICMRRKQVGEPQIDGRGKRGREMSIKDPGRAEISIERRTSKINCWEKMQTKCFCSGERQRIRTDCSHLNSLEMLHFHLNCLQDLATISLSSETPTLQLAGSAAPERSAVHAQFWLSEPVTGALSPLPSMLTAATGDVYKWDL